MNRAPVTDAPRLTMALLAQNHSGTLHACACMDMHTHHACMHIHTPECRWHACTHARIRESKPKATSDPRSPMLVPDAPARSGFEFWFEIFGARPTIHDDPFECHVCSAPDSHARDGSTDCTLAVRVILGIDETIAYKERVSGQLTGSPCEF